LATPADGHWRRSGERDTLAVDAEIAVRNAHRWFEHNSGWATPDDDTLAEWIADGVCRCPDECLVAPEGWCEHGLASWTMILAALGREDANSLTMGLEGRIDD
jgi:hypothetical protein